MLYYDISDHLPIFIICEQSELSINNNARKHVLRRRETKQNIGLLNFDLAQEDWCDILNATDAKLLKKGMGRTVVHFNTTATYVCMALI